jgi:pimeloyl-ACP methyl ester carboxylesterase
MPTSRKLPLPTGLNYHVLEWGDPEAEHTVLLLHGFLDHAWTWENVVDAGLGAAGWRVVAPDLRGHGDSDWIGPGGYYHFADYIADVHALVHALQPRSLSLVGHSMGGSVAAYFAGAFPERVRKLALLEGLGPPQSRDTAPERMQRWVHAWKAARERAPKSYATVEEAAARLVEHDPLLPRELALKLAEKGTAPALGGRVRFKHDPLHATPGPIGFHLMFAREFWQGVACPTLVVMGAQSLLRHTPEEEQRRVDALPHARRVTIEGAGHMLMRHQPARLAETLRAFLEEP